MEKKTRREFLKEAGTAALGLGWALPLAAAGCAPRGHNIAGSQRQWAMVVDLEKIQDPAVREAAQKACARTHNIPHIPDPQEEIQWIRVESFEHVFEDQIHGAMPPHELERSVLVLCNHCTNPPCVRVCPTQATWKRESDGIVMMDMHRCIGCRYCMAACPYGSRSFNWRDPRPFIETDAEGKFLSDFPTRTRGVVEKCNFCAERLRDGLEPACVEAVREVPGGEGALVFGDLTDPHSEVSHILRETPSRARRVTLGTGPNVFYIG